MILLSLLTDTPMPSQRYAIDGAILLKSVEENTKEVTLTRKLPSTVTND